MSSEHFYFNVFLCQLLSYFIPWANKFGNLQIGLFICEILQNFPWKHVLLELYKQGDYQIFQLLLNFFQVVDQQVWLVLDIFFYSPKNEWVLLKQFGFVIFLAERQGDLLEQGIKSLEYVRNRLCTLIQNTTDFLCVIFTHYDIIEIYIFMVA